ncbi:hypothetical protein LXL04_039710 [Taraxacum kok-saghyz]
MSSTQRKATKPTKPTKTTKKKSAPPLIAIPPAGCYLPQPVDSSMAFGQYSPNLGMQQQLVNNWLQQSSSPSLESLSKFTPESQFLRTTSRRLEQLVTTPLAWLACADCSHQIWSACANMLNADVSIDLISKYNIKRWKLEQHTKSNKNATKIRAYCMKAIEDVSRKK